MARWLFILLAVAWLSPGNTHARPSRTPHAAELSLTKIASVAGIPMDSFEGSPSDPLSLHKYLYCAADPVDRIDPSGYGSLIGVSMAMTIETSLHPMYDTGVSSVGFAMMDTIWGVAEDKSADAIFQDYWFNTAVGLAIGLGVGKVFQIADEAVFGGEFAIPGGVTRRLNSILRDYWAHNGGLNATGAKAAAAVEGYGFVVGSKLRLTFRQWPQRSDNFKGRSV